MSEVYAIFSPIFGIVLQGIDELELGPAKIFRNPVARAFSKSVPWQDELPNVRIPANVVIEGAPPAPFDADLRQLGIANYLLQMEIETPTNELSGGRVSEELEWAVLPLRILTPARILTGVSKYCQGGCVHSGLSSGGIKGEVRREGLLASAPEPYGSSTTCTVTREAAKIIAEFASVVDKHRGSLSVLIGMAIDTFSKSFCLPSYVDRGISLLIALETLLSEKGKKQGIKDIVVKRAADFLGAGRSRGERKQRQRLIGEAFDRRKDIEHGNKVKGVEEEKYFACHLEELEDTLRHILFKAICALDQGNELAEILPGLHQVSASCGGQREQGREHTTRRVSL